MWQHDQPDNGLGGKNERDDEFNSLLLRIDELARHKLGYPVSLLTYFGAVDNKVLGITPGSLANVLLNNVGDPFKDSETSLMEVKRHERDIIAILEHFFGMKEDTVRGYVTTGGTEGNFAGLWWTKRYLINSTVDTLIHYDDTIKKLERDEQESMSGLSKIHLNDYTTRTAALQNIITIKNAIAENKNIVQQLLTPTVMFSKNHTHYSIPKISEILHMNVKPIQANEDGGMDLDAFKKELIFHLSAHPFSPVIVITNIGTTITGAIDDVPGIKKILEEMNPKPKYSIHMDGALTGFVLPILKPFGEVENYFDAIGVNSLVFSAHKYPGLSQPCGVILSRKEFFDKAFERGQRNVDYVGNINDVTITGSRSGLNVLMFYNALCTLGLNKNNEVLNKMVQENIAISRYLYEELVKVYGSENVLYPYHFNVIFPKPSMLLAKKFQLMITGKTATICVLPNVTKELIQLFLIDLKEDIKTTLSLETRSVT
jgi:histidine decarboxylase